MASNLQHPRRIGLYEKALPAQLELKQRLRIAQELGFHYWELSVDESDERLSRLTWSRRQRAELCQQSWDLDFPIHSMCLSGHRRYPFGSKDPAKRQRAAEIMTQGIELAYDLGIRIVQLAGYDVYYEANDEETHELFLEGMRHACQQAARAGVILAMEIMDTPYLNSIDKYLALKKEIPSPFLAVYPDLGNLFAWNNDIQANLRSGMHEIVALHLKDTLRVREGFSGQFRDLIIGDGEVDFIRYFKILKNLEYSGPFVIEMWAQNNNVSSEAIEICRQDLTRALSHIHQAMDQAKF